MTPTGLISEAMNELKVSLAELTKAVASNTGVLANVVACGLNASKSFADMASAFPSPATSKRRRVESVDTPVPRKTVVGSGSGRVASIELRSVVALKGIVASQLHTSTTDEKLCSYLKEVHSLDTSSSSIRCKKKSWSPITGQKGSQFVISNVGLDPDLARFFY